MTVKTHAGRFDASAATAHGHPTAVSAPRRRPAGKRACAAAASASAAAAAAPPGWWCAAAGFKWRVHRKCASVNTNVPRLFVLRLSTRFLNTSGQNSLHTNKIASVGSVKRARSFVYLRDPSRGRGGGSAGGARGSE